MSKIVIQLLKPMPASDDCLPHAAMNLGGVRGSSMRPMPGMVSKLVIEEKMGSWVFFRLDDCGGFVGDSWHGTRADAVHQAKREFGIEVADV